MRPLLLSLVCTLIATAAFAAPPALSDKAKPIFDGKSLDGWESPTAGLWSVRDGALTGGNGQKVPHNDFLCTKQPYANFLLRLQIKLTGDPATGMINSGVQIRSTRVPGSAEASGYQCDFGEPNWYGALYDESRRNRVLMKSDMEALGPVLKRNDWNEYVIRADGPRIQTWINGVQGMDYTEPDESIPLEGVIGIQIHGGGIAQVQVKDIAIEELPPIPPGQRFIGAPAAAAPPKESPLSPEEERKTFTLPPGFEIELVAAESEGIGKFITVDWDQHGRMWSMTALEYPVDGNENPERARALYENPGKDKVLVFDDVRGPGPHQPRIYADGLAIPLGILPQPEGVYVQHGTQIELLQDTDGDGRADSRKTILTGFGVQDSHLLMHQFTRMPGGWIWAAQGAFNSGKVKTTGGEETDFPSTRMARFRPDGSQFDILCNGPCNIWGFAQNAEGELFIQEANDYGYPCMPFQIGANYPGCADRLFKSYAPEFPGTAPDFRMGGTGLSGLALCDDEGAFPKPYAGAMYVANPIIRKIQALRMRREGPRWALAKLPDFIESSDPMFRPVSTQFAPDGALYIVDWYNKVISHNEVPRNHPDRDKIRGRIWRVKHTEQPLVQMPDLTKCPVPALMDELTGPSVRRANLAWQAIVDRKLGGPIPSTLQTLFKGSQPALAIRALWAMEGIGAATPSLLQTQLTNSDRNVVVQCIGALARLSKDHAQTVSMLAPLADSPDPEIRAEVIRAVSGFYNAPSDAEGIGVAKELPGTPIAQAQAIGLLLKMAKPSLDAPIEPSTRNKKPTRVREAYDREFERYLIRQALEQNAKSVANYLSAAEASSLPVENRILGTLALDPRDSAVGLSKLLPNLERSPNDEELLRLAKFPDEPRVREALQGVLQSEKTGAAALEALLRLRSRLDETKLRPLLASPAAALIQHGTPEGKAMGYRLVASFALKEVEPEIFRYAWREIENPAPKPGATIALALNALAELKSHESELFVKYFETYNDPAVRDAALNGLAQSPSPAAPQWLFGLWKNLSSAQRRTALDRLSSTPGGARAITAAFEAKTLQPQDFDGSTIDRLQTVLRGDAALKPLMDSLGSLFKPVLRITGGNDSYAEPETPLTLTGPFTVETWVRLDPGIGNEDGILGSREQLDMNFFGEKFRVWVSGPTHDAIVAKKKIAPENWTHVAVTRNAAGELKIYIDGELDQAQGKPAPQPFSNLKIGWTQVKKGTSGMFAEYRIWAAERTAEEIRNNFDRALDPAAKNDLLLYHAPPGGPWGKLHGSAAIARTSDYPPLFTPEEATALDQKFAKYRQLAAVPGGDIGRGKLVAAVCMACHLIQGQGGNIAPNISGAGTMGVEALLRNIITPNAAMEAGYRIFRVELKSGELIDGFFVSEDKDAIVVRLPGLPDRRLPRPEVRQTQYLRRSLMPEGLLDGMTPPQVTDLFAYLMSLKG
jgi:putative membrane-bound dehydrogenase-like protein